MPIENLNQRSSAIHVGLPWRGIFPEPDTSISKSDRLHIAGYYAMDLSLAITSTSIIQKPVDCVLAGDQDNLVRRGRAAGRALRRAFNE